MELACCFLSSQQGSEGRNTHLHAVPNDAVLCLSVCVMHGVSVCVRERRRRRGEEKGREFAPHNGLADAFFSSQMGYIFITLSAAFLMK